ncbi:glycosyltransferase family 2 protein [Arthrobacter sp. H14-L1]|uniref:glycosyltransferase family 2 protein n=1 Tax=Arthrobacter sp. H14-L1 TaxID=2996697 RepID=UPI002270A8B2|nr:glycosyltransferase family 2 protein [Arthrobacter sp. H14-L1]MCY0905734.1 glycosyltransferase family 2 protein [Arthrobacter sp. H14-L1]
MHLTVAVLTYNRPTDLAALLPLLTQQIISVRSDELAAEILVVDNDPRGGACTSVQAYASQSPSVQVRYQNERRPGISAARNKALSDSARSDLLVFIDDDERPTDQWLCHLLATYQDYHPAAVVGPVVSEFEHPPEPWILAGEFFKRRRLATGTKVSVAATNNLLLDLRHVRSADLFFDLEFGITGGDDTMFTRQLHKSGGAMIWCDEAVVLDIVPATRLTRRWVLQRAFSSGNTWSLVSIKLADRTFSKHLCRVRLSWKGIVRMIAGLGRTGIGFVSGLDRHQAKGLRTLARGAGIVAGVFAYRFQEYRRR